MPAHTASRSVLCLLFDGVQSLDVTGPLEAFAGAAAALGEPDAYRLRTASVGGRTVRSTSGVRLAADEDVRDSEPPHTLLVPGGPGTRDSAPELVDWVRRHAPDCRRVVSVCSGAFVLAEAGLLDGRRATTHWSLGRTLAERYPRVRVDTRAIFLRDGRLSTSAGVTSGIDLALAIVEEDHGREVALSVARHLVVFLRRPGNQTQFSAQLAAQTAVRRPLREVQRWITEHPEADLGVEALAARAGLSPRHFSRAFRQETGVTPGRHVAAVRLEAARRRLEDTDDSVERISRQCGYGTAEAMRRAFLAALGTGPQEYRRRFRSHPGTPAGESGGAPAGDPDDGNTHGNPEREGMRT
ncbi:GlxA family transcriptional regulator [Streptomyces durbertensis]|uniref:GlxA family transcriptional regulator n=1 Tax=Streptomyces durbertensis TaxID=2448886 RepID=A0ABR6ELK6_9ACTN|nr:GlxA family transcriptional regulator [Streptomyces durbertensis]MBB1246192.1 GlxA family transcriptional regulator [Streptomyces durbertensis]